MAKKKTDYTKAMVVHFGRSDGKDYPAAEIDSARKGSRKDEGTKIGEPIPQDIVYVDIDLLDISEEEKRRKKTERKHMVKFRTALGLALANELGWDKGPKNNPIQYISELPDAYHLREVQYNSGAKEAHIYGHPSGCVDKFVYRSPSKFLPHLVWLLSDSNDREDCLCEACHKSTERPFVTQAKPVALENKDDTQSPAPSAAKNKSTSSGSNSGPSTSSKSASAPAFASGPAAKTNKRDIAPSTTPKSVAKSAGSARAVAAGPSGVASQAQAATVWSVDAALLNDEPTLFREGEMVWFQQERAWRIGVIGAVTSTETSSYTILPLGHSGLHLMNVDKRSQEMRPFLTFSVPSISDSLPELQGKMFNEIDWVEIGKTSKEKRPEVVGLEASKMAAVQIDSSWSMFNGMDMPAGKLFDENDEKSLGGVSYYGGVFLGAEQVRIGDSIRAKDKSKQVVLQVKDIIVDKHNLLFRGDTWYTALVPAGQVITNQPQGAIFVKDATFRTGLLHDKNFKVVWVQQAKDEAWKEVDVAGRSYVTSELMTVTDPTGKRMAKAVEQGKPEESSNYLNNRMQNSASRNIGRQPSRRATVGAAVSTPLVLGDGIVEE